MRCWCAFTLPIFVTPTVRQRCNCFATAPAMKKDSTQRCDCGLTCLGIWLSLFRASIAMSMPHCEQLPRRSVWAAPPSFFVLEDESPRPGAFFLAGVLTLLALAGFSMGINHAGSYAGNVTVWSGEPESLATSWRPSVAKASPFESRWRSMLERLGVSQPRTWQIKPLAADRAMNSAAGAAMKLDAAERQLVIDGAIAM